jgi:hypothetical protein
MLVKILGLLDIIAALMIIFNIYGIHYVITFFFVIIFVIKGLSILLADALGVVMGLTDIVAGLFILFAVVGLMPLKIIIFVILIGKGFMSLV